MSRHEFCFSLIVIKMKLEYDFRSRKCVRCRSVNVSHEKILFLEYVVVVVFAYFFLITSFLFHKYWCIMKSRGAGMATQCQRIYSCVHPFKGGR